MSEANKGALRLGNAGRSCYINAALQLITMMPELCEDMGIDASALAQFLHGLYSHKWGPKSEAVSFVDILKWVRTCLPPEAHYTGRDGDAHEFFRAVVDAVQMDKASGGDARVQKALHGKFHWTTTCTVCRQTSHRIEKFDQLSVFIGKEDMSVKAYLEGIFAQETLEGDNAYHCDTCGQKTTAVRQQYIRQFPKYLVLQVLRFNAAQKVLTPFRFVHRFRGEQDTDPIYQLVGVVVHMGRSKASGHYQAYGVTRMDTERWEESEWGLYDDARGKRERAEALTTSAVMRNAYILMYKRIN